MTRTAYMHSFDAARPCPVERACFAPGRARRRHECPRAYTSTAPEEYGDRAECAVSGGFIRPDRLTVRNGKFVRRWHFDYLAAGM